eukprot:3170823-Pleurochrysis_carterae.AAC.6
MRRIECRCSICRARSTFCDTWMILRHGSATHFAGCLTLHGRLFDKSHRTMPVCLPCVTLTPLSMRELTREWLLHSVR